MIMNLPDVHRYASFSDMLEGEGLAKVLPGVKTINEGEPFLLTHCDRVCQ